MRLVMKKGIKGFTLVELIAVIAILGILSAYAIPKYVSLKSSARKAAMQGLAGALQGAAATVQAAYKAQGLTTSPVTLDDGSTTVAVNTSTGFPTTAGISSAANISSDFTASVASGVTTFNFTSGTIANCNVTYTEATGTAAATTSGC